MSVSPGTRILRSVNILIAAIAAVALAVVYWFAWRPLPQRSGSVQAPIEALVSVAFDARGVPHIRASSVEDALFVQGYVTAQDRLWQMDSLRRLSAGDLAEIVGPAALESDRESRRMRNRRIAEQAYVTLDPSSRAAFAAYARGVNFFISGHRNRLPVEFSLLGYQPRPWSAVDSLLLCLHMFRTLTSSWREELIRHEMLAHGDAAKVDALFAIRTGDEPPPGSNAWAISGSRTASGKPLLSNDMHLEYSLPGIWYMTHLEAPGLNVSGVTVPGLPGIVVGHNQRIAWGITNLGFDVQDLYIEKIDERTGQYLYDGHVEQARIEREIIPVKGHNAEELPIWVTRHGPIFANAGHEHMALRWIVAQPGLLQYPILDIDRASNWGEFTSVLARFPGPGSNFVYADVDGNIGYHAAGVLPKRRGYSGAEPVDGSNASYDWDGVIPFDQLPSAFNPASGIIASANQDPFPPDYGFPVNGNFASKYRADQIRALLGARNGWRAAQMLAVQKDVYSAFSQFLAQQIVAAYDRRHAGNASLGEAIGLLRNWNGQMSKSAAAPLLISLAYQRVRATLAEKASPGSGATFELGRAAGAIEKLLRQRPAGWVDDWDNLLLTALVDAVEEGSRMQRGDLKRWQYGAWRTLTITNPVTHGIPWIGKYFDIGPVPMSGSVTTVKQSTRALGPSMRMNADLGNWDNSLLNIVTGQSGQVLSRHYRDEWDAYYNARSYPMAFQHIEVTSTLDFHP